MQQHTKKHTMSHTITTTTTIAHRSRATNRHRFGCLSVAAIVFLATIWSSPRACQALSTPSKPSSVASPFGGIFGSNINNDRIAIEIFDPADEKTLGLLKDCRRMAFASTKQNFLDSERDFVAAKSVVEGKNLCAIARDTKDGSVVGSADLTPKSKGVNAITNVFVRPDQRGKGIGRRLMVEGIEGVLANNLPQENQASGGTEAILSLDVYTQNTPAFKLYQNMGYEPSSVMHSGTLALANALGTNFEVSMSKTVSIDPEKQ